MLFENPKDEKVFHLVGIFLVVPATLAITTRLHLRVVKVRQNLKK